MPRAQFFLQPLVFRSEPVNLAGVEDCRRGQVGYDRQDGEILLPKLAAIHLVDDLDHSQNGPADFQGSSAMLTDITDKKRAEEELLRLNEEVDAQTSASASLQPVELAPLIDSTVEITRTQWHTVARVETVCDPELPTVNGIRSELGVVLLNLIVNAAHAIGDGRGVEPGQGLIRIVTRRNGDWAEIAVTDNGCGIPGELQQKIFEPFFTTREVGKGSGHGLAIAYNIIAGNHHGELLVDSGPGKGTTFTVRLPLAAHAVVCPWPK